VKSCGFLEKRGDLHLDMLRHAQHEMLGVRCEIWIESGELHLDGLGVLRDAQCEMLSTKARCEMWDLNWKWRVAPRRARRTSRCSVWDAQYKSSVYRLRIRIITWRGG